MSNKKRKLEEIEGDILPPPKMQKLSAIETDATTTQMQTIDILDPNLESSHPQLVPWVQGMRSADYSDDQIRMYFQQAQQKLSALETVTPNQTENKDTSDQSSSGKPVLKEDNSKSETPATSVYMVMYRHIYGYTDPPNTCIRIP